MRLIYSVFLMAFLMASFETNSQPATIVGTAIGEPGDTVSIPIDYIGTGSDAVGFQVDINFDNTNLTVGLNCNATLGDAGIGCVDNGTFVRIIVFGITNNPLPNGQVGILDFTISPGVIVPNNFLLSVSNEVYSQSNGVGVPANGSVDGLITVEPLFSVGGNISGLGSSSVTLQNNIGDDLILSANGPFVFPIKLTDLSPYEVSVLNHPNMPGQTCIVSGGANNDGSGSIASVDENNIQVACNNSPIVVADFHSILEDFSLIADDVDGSINGVNDDGVLANDTDNEPLTIVAPGVIDPISGIGGQLTIDSNGTFQYIPPSDAFGIATHTFEVTDGISTVSSTLSIDVLPVNDSPTFDILGNVDAVGLLTLPNVILQIPNFANNINLGELENTQLVQQFIVDVISDTNAVIETGLISVNNAGDLEIDFTLNEGVALVELSLQDDGGVINGGSDISGIIQFSVSYLESIYEDSFEDGILFKYIDSQKGLILENRLISYTGHFIELYNTNGKLISLKKLQAWVEEIKRYQNEQF